MAQGFRVRYRSADETVLGEDVRFQLPIRMGRNELNHCRIVDRFVSDFHAQVELADGKLCVRDLHSKNGVFSPSGDRVGLDAPFELTPPDHAFVLGHFVRVQIEVFEQGRAVADERMSRSIGAVLGNQSMLRPGSGDSQPFAQPAPLPALSMIGGPAAIGAPAASPAPAPWAAPQPSLMASLPALAPMQPSYGRPLPQAPAAGPAPPRPAMQGTQHFQIQVDTLALLGLKELAGSLVPGAPLETTGDVARLITKLHDAIEVFCRCFVPLREGYSQFVSQMDLRRAASQRTMNRSASAMRVEAAKDPSALAAALLDWRNQDYDVPQAVEGIFADLMIHQIAMIDSVMRGVHALLQELSPEKIEQALKEERHGVSALLGRYRGLWQAFEKRHEELSDETRTFEVVFGADFAAAYRDHVARERTGS
jgi:type VI secretion system protein ImpI